MAKCALSIHLEDERTLYRAGDTLRGEVAVRTDEAVQCDGLQIDLRWRTHGKGNTARGPALSQDLFRGRWRAGTEERYPFTIELPAGPFTYHGHYLNVVWELQAQADIPWAFDPKAEREIVLEANPEVAPDWHAVVADVNQLPFDLQEGWQEKPGQPVTPPPSQQDTHTAAGGCLLGFFVPALLVTAYQGVSFARGAIPTQEALLWIGFGSALTAALGIGAFLLLRNRIAGKKLGAVTGLAEPQFLRAGNDLQVAISCTPQESTELLAATAQLQAEEVVVQGSGTSESTYRHVVFDQRIELSSARILSPRIPFQAAGAFPIPADAPPSFFAPSNQLNWTLTLRLEVARWPDWVEKKTILVHR